MSVMTTDTTTHTGITETTTVQTISTSDMTDSGSRLFMPATTMKDGTDIAAADITDTISAGVKETGGSVRM